MHDLRGNFFLNGKRRRGKERRKGEGKHRNEEGRGGKGDGKKGEIAPGRWGNEAENTHKGNGKPKDGERRAERTTKRKKYRDERHARKI